VKFGSVEGMLLFWDRARRRGPWPPSGGALLTCCLDGGEKRERGGRGSWRRPGSSSVSRSRQRLGKLVAAPWSARFPRRLFG
jgi:hypothetical protein